MDVSDHIEESDLARVNESDYDYADYYLLEELADFWPCEKHHVRKISRYLLPVFYSVACALGFLANLGLVLVCTRRTSTRMRLRMAVHPACALCANLLFTCTLPFWAVYAARDWIFGARACKAVTLVYAVGLYGGNLFGACALLRSCVDAACALRCTGRLGDARRNAAWCACVWTLACLAAVPHLSFVEESHVHGETHCSYHYTQGWKVYMRLQLVLLVFLVPFLIFLGSSIALFLRTRSSGCSSRMLRRAIISTGLFFALWFPYTLVLTLHVLQDLHIVSECGDSVHLDLAIQSTECIAFSHVFINPVAYLLLNRRAWRTLRVKCLSSREYLLDSSENTDSVSSQDSGVELRALQNFQSFSNPENEQGTAEKQCHLLPYAT